MLDVLVAHDLSDFADRGVAALRAMELPIRRMHVVCVLPRLDPNHPGVVWSRDDDELRRQHALRELDRRFSAEDAVFHTVIGEPGARIVEVARETGVALIALPTHGRTGIRRMVEGSVAEHVARFAPCPVLVVPPDAATEASTAGSPHPAPRADESPGEMVDALAVQVCDQVDQGQGWLTSITVRVPPGDPEPWVRRIEERLSRAGIDNVDILATPGAGPLALLHTRFEEA